MLLFWIHSIAFEQLHCCLTRPCFFPLFAFYFLLRVALEPALRRAKCSAIPFAWEGLNSPLLQQTKLRMGSSQRILLFQSLLESIHPVRTENPWSQLPTWKPGQQSLVPAGLVAVCWCPS